MRNLLLLTSAVVFFDTLFFSALTPLLPHFADELSLGKTGAGVLAAAYPAGAFLGAIPSGILAARFGLKLSVLVGMTTVAVCTVLFGLAQEAWQLDLARFLQGVASAFTWTGALGWLVAAAPSANRGALIGRAFAAAVGGALFGPVVGGVASVAGIGWTFGALAAASFALVVWAALTPSAVSDEPQDPSALVRALGDRSILGAGWFVLLPALLFGTLSVLAPLRLSALGFGAVAIGAVFLCSAALEAGNNVLLGHASDRLGPVVLLTAGLVASIVVAALLPWPDQAYVLALLVVCAGLAFGTFFTPGDDAALEPGRVARSPLRLCRRADQPRVGARADARCRRGRRARRGDERRGAVPRALRRVRRDARRAAAGAPDAGLGDIPRGSRLRAVKKVLVANRGEIALRVFRAARELGLGTVAVVAPDDTGSLHARSADETVEIASYLEPAEHIRAARETGADAIHPGYGFLSENSDFADAVDAAGLAWVGPPADALRRGGDKLEAKRIAAEAGVPTVPEATEPPLIVKAAAGGGGRGMRIVRSLDELDDALAAARREAQAGFGDDRVYLERYLERPRHVEIQLLADLHGTVLALGERECSVQRRHQKVLEESPSTALDTELRAQMSDAAVRFARAIGYVSAGTAEFVLEGREFFFLELNGRIQVEHPVTEAVWDIDLVQWQLRIARGERLDVQPRPGGAAVEVRLYAEDPRTFLPQAGRLERLRLPTTVRVESGVAEGDEIGTGYDPMIAKLIAAGATRDRGTRPARSRARRDRSRGRHDQPALPPLARRAPRAARRRNDNCVPERAPATVGPAGQTAGSCVARGLPPQPAAAADRPRAGGRRRRR